MFLLLIHLLAGIFIALLAAGCRNKKNRIEKLHRQNKLLKDENTWLYEQELTRLLAAEERNGEE